MVGERVPATLGYQRDAAPAAQRRTILVVDDEAMIVRVLQRVLTYAGYAVITAEDGHKALAVARATTPDLVITDIGLPGLAGDEVLAAMRAAPETAHIPVILMSGSPLVRSNATWTAFLLKPFAVYDVLERIQQVLGGNDWSEAQATYMADEENHAHLSA